ncbi:MAG: fused MFS/spermidine synthase [Candidatus Thiodiazotropha endolucinida]|nr:fused MFS/spermidine synthase [Candidatus Thiodiazotropha taylori]MCW4273801.1 fused MFS/spermidine synthase [Candidatus Thiodiazotropha taylori]
MSDQSAATVSNRLRLLGFSLTVFLSSAALLVLEILAGRLLAPHIGVSLYTWTSIIGVILAGLSLGNWLGGVWADRGADGRVAGVAMALAGIYAMLALPLMDSLGGLLAAQQVGLLGSSFVFAFTLFAPPAVAIGIVTPLLTTRALDLDPRAGHVVGRMHALAAIGSIVGTFAAGYWLVQSFGSRAILFGTGVGLILLAAPFLMRMRLPVLVILVLATLFSALLSLSQQGLRGSCDRESQYFCIRVVDRSSDAPFGQARGMVLDHLLHGINHDTDPRIIIAPYVHAIDELVYAHFNQRYDAGLEWFFLGGGSYTHPRAVQALSPESSVTVAELDPMVTLTAVEKLYLEPEAMRILHEDGRRALTAESGKFDVIVGDVFHDVAIPEHMVTLEFAEIVRQRLRADGIYLMNIVDAFPDPRLVRAISKTLSEVFTHVDLWMEGVPGAERVTFVLSATNSERPAEIVQARFGFERTWFRVTEKLMALGKPLDELPILTDDYAPVERLIAGLLLGERD